MLNEKLIGVCSICGGDVVNKPVPQCIKCGAIQKAKTAKVIEMEDSNDPQLLNG